MWALPTVPAMVVYCEDMIMRGKAFVLPPFHGQPPSPPVRRQRRCGLRPTPTHHDGAARPSAQVLEEAPKGEVLLESEPHQAELGPFHQRWASACVQGPGSCSP